MTRGPVSIVFRKRYHRSLCPSKLGFIVQDLSRSSRWTGEVQIDMCHTHKCSCKLQKSILSPPPPFPAILFVSIHP